ncbi:MATE efflux family protein [Emticicia oligotrophica DSM 17448]|uniref:Multidrug-efflux transporter n=1 Tax=Emticicia oligotrophica (strain DSM 17448 / CIP 109782 / MTCC 6937 / GPTSA100-15) TaxID=929562 RepID=A0ABN4AK07_EMTOG|nr:MATE family efflux transporter [Emticicia oligotrophica]AFK02480.1 MATE efflux family protein [Emticicia oligotrophica DSM 17448]
MRKIFDLFIQALRGEEQNYTDVSINRAIFLLSVPMIFEMVGESLFAVVDAFFVARYVGTEGVATVGLTESVLTLIYSVAIGLSSAATAIVARRVGEGNKTEAGLAVAQVILISLLLGLSVGITGFIFAEDILRLMGGNEHLIEKGSSFTQIIFASSPSIVLLYTLSGALRGAGDASTAMRSILLANFINIFMDFLLIPIMGLGVEGAAIATSVGRTIGVLYQLYALFGGNGNIQILKKQFIPDKEVIKNLLSIAAGGTGQFLIQSASWIFLTRILSSFGSEVVAGYTIAIRIIIFTILPSWGMSNAAATLVGQNLGAGKPERAEQSVWRTAFYNMIFLLTVGIIFAFFAESFVGIFTTEAHVIEIGVLCLQIICLGYIFFGYGMVIGQSLNGAGDTLSPTIMNFVCFWLIEIPLAYFLAKTLNWGPNGVFWSIAISESILAIVAIFVFRRGRWKRMKV